MARRTFRIVELAFAVFGGITAVELAALVLARYPWEND